MHGCERIPTDRAVLFAVNHPTAFFDPILVASNIGPTTHFLLRGDVFGNPLIRWLLGQIKTIPVFRFRDGHKNLKKNQATFDHCYDLLAKGKNILVLAEGQTIHEKRLRPIQKGTARLMLGAYEKHPAARLCVLPFGVNYSASNKFRGELMSGFGQPILLEEYLSAYEENPRKAVKQITDEITRQLKEKVVHIDRDEDAPFVNRLLTYLRNDRNKYLLPVASTSLRPIEEEVQLAQTINQANEPTRLSIRNNVEQYDSLLKKHHINDIGVARPGYYNPLNTLLMFLGFPIFLLGFLPYYLPFLAGKIVADKKVKTPAFYGSIRFGVALLIYMIPTLILLLIAATTLNGYLLLGILTFYILLYLALTWRDLNRYWWEGWKWSQLNDNQKKELKHARKTAMAI